ncbi:methionine adenosyltransferase [Mucisphaera calidilacus]|uniref:S-adenosylmethionine synthase n=1 Tax=Mucisphaera calidilacus TaxID=2527982 RepID=A0A518BVI9_9BACT|nr:methionine adenosyltransferase [Mucisphaera calidilacus]QDU70988.1 S-adenosylmethionine synthase [Mucisphaera calidilacus]
MPKRGHTLFTSESVSMGHPDKVSDQISDAVLDLLIGLDPAARVACETMCTTGLVVIGGEITVHTPKAVAALNDVEDACRDTLKKIGYTGDIGMRFDADGCGVVRTFHGQSADISRGVDDKTTKGKQKEPGAGDQGLMFGFACRETASLMPLPIDLSHRLVERHAMIRNANKIKGLRPDAKSQVTVEYDENGRPACIDTVVLSTQHTADWNGAKKQAKLKQEIIKHVINPVMPKKLYDPKRVTIHVNPTGQFEVGGPHGDVGLTGRKIIVDTYGGRGRHGGGAFSGKDPSKVDRSAAYMARYVAKNVVAARLAEQCEVQLSYAIGVAEPTSVNVETFGTSKIDEHELAEAIVDIFPLTPRGIIEHLKLRSPIYTLTAAHGHFGRKPGKVSVNGKQYETFTWEKTDLADALAKALR